MAGLVKEFASGIYNLLLGMFTTGKHLTRHAITIQYPKERWEMPERSRGMVVLLTDHDTGQLNCNACLLCMKACPSAAIDIEVYRDENKKKHLRGFTVDYNICCLCGLCEESCNFAGIKLAPKYEYPEFEKGNLTFDIKKLQEMGLDVPYELPERKKAAKAKKEEAETKGEGGAEKAADEAPAPKTEAPANPGPAADDDSGKEEGKA